MAPTLTVLRRRGESQSQQPSTLVDARCVAPEHDLAFATIAVDLARRWGSLRDFAPGALGGGSSESAGHKSFMPTTDARLSYTQRAAASAVSSGRVLKAMAAPGAAL
jgi:hypothetical protein